ncbi:NAD(P)-dependent oxidoreductase [Desulfonema ishimotonii]|uniref:NAD(P)-dependent oxidoreductase n=1 Tax=Desulfonema ishimotonii TaxID=45657 RepID=A0A401G332_9BACT|nr:NAD(P)-dependent oxidoreductase [Desulfonema ishimotonii]GBC63626.1 NAD(P)-dependent oxidoreductase [Desulfonema ishimotonii]
MLQKIGFIGTGIMGQPMSVNILNQGYDLMVWNRTIGKTGLYQATGARVAETPREVGEWADVLILMLTGPEAIDAVLAGDRGALTGKTAARTLINMSTVPPDYTIRLGAALQDQKIAFLDAPVTGTRKPAEEGGLVILAGGDAEKISEMEPLLLAMGKKVIRCGPVGQGSAMKMAFNLLLGTLMAGLCEAVNLGRGSGLPFDTVMEALRSGPLDCGLFGLKSDMLEQDDFPAQFPLRHMAKDLRFALKTADEKGIATPVGQALFQLYRQGDWDALGDMDFAAVKKVLDAMNDASEEGAR